MKEGNTKSNTKPIVIEERPNVNPPAQDLLMAKIQETVKYTAIDFAEWLVVEGWATSGTYGTWEMMYGESEDKSIYTTEQLYDKFLMTIKYFRRK